MASYDGTIAERFEWVQMILQRFKQALTGSKLKFLGTINNSGLFKDSSSLLDHIDKLLLLQIFAKCRAYTFYIESHINVNYSTHILDTILRFDAIIRCSKIGVKFIFRTCNRTRLPIDAIENWLNFTNANGRKDNERFLKLKIYDDVSNISEMFTHLKKVCHFFSRRKYNATRC